MANKQIAQFQAAATIADTLLIAAQPALNSPNLKPTALQLKEYVKSGLLASDITDFSQAALSAISSASAALSGVDVSPLADGSFTQNKQLNLYIDETGSAVRAKVKKADGSFYDVQLSGAAILWQNNFNYGQLYSPYEAVAYNGSSYIAINSNQYDYPDSGSGNWGVLAQKGAQGDQGATGATGDQGPAGPQGPAGSDGFYQIGSSGGSYSIANGTSGSTAYVKGLNAGSNITISDSGSYLEISSSGGGGSYPTLYNNGSSFGNPSGINFTGNVSLSYDGYGVQVNVTGGGGGGYPTIYNNGSSYGNPSGINFTGGCAVSSSGYGVDVYVTPGPQGDPGPTGPQGPQGDPGPAGPINTVYNNGTSYGSPSGLNFIGGLGVSNGSYGVDISLPQGLSTSDSPTFVELNLSSTLGHALNIIDNSSAPHGYLQFKDSSGGQKGYVGFPAVSSTELTYRNNIGSAVYSVPAANEHRFEFDGSDILTITTGAAALGTKLLIPGVNSANYGALQVTTTNAGDTVDWVAATFGGSEAASQPKVIMGSLNGFATLAAHRYDMLAYRPLVLNGLGDLSNSGNEVWVPNRFRTNKIASFNGLGYTEFEEPARCSIAPSNSADLVNKAYVDPKILPSWLTTFEEGVAPNRYARIVNNYNFACTLGYLIQTGVYNEYPSPNFGNAPWGFLLSQTTTNDFDNAGIGQYGVGNYLSCFRRNQVAAGLNMGFEGRSNGTSNRDDVRFLVDSRAMIKGTVAEWFFYRTDNPSGARNASIRMNENGALVFGGYDDTWDPLNYTQMFILNVLSGAATFNGQLYASGSITVGQNFIQETLGTLRVTSGGDLLFFDGASWRTVAFV